MEFGIMFFASAEQTRDSDPYHLLKEVARFADEHGFRCIWTPERHFHDFGGLYPNPSVVSAALAMITTDIQIRAGSLISPLHDPIRIAEEWALVDNLSAGRIAISFGSGWNVDDFIFFPDRYADRQKVMYEQIDIVRKLWRGCAIDRTNGKGKPASIKILPTPVQSTLPVWITSSGNMDTFKRAGAAGANILTHLLGQDVVSLAEKISAYRESRAASGYDPEEGIVSLMLHTYIGDDLSEVKAEVRSPFREYLRSAISLEREAALGGGKVSGGKHLSADEISTNHVEEVLDIACERYFNTSALMGTPTTCIGIVNELEKIGVNEVAALVDFGLPTDRVLAGLSRLNALRENCSHAPEQDASGAVLEFVGEF
jgi:natural product biosynthesis luciferase-like monooxygenase protein